MSQDTIETFKGSVIQHGSSNDRIYLMKLSTEATSSYPSDLIDLANRNHYTKVFAKIPENKASMFLEAGFKEEARIPAFFSGKETALFMGLFLNIERKNEAEATKMESFLKIATEKANTESRKLKEGFVCRACKEADAKAMTEIYKEVFPSYPFPIHDPNYLIETMNEHIDYFGIETKGKLVAISSAEMDKKSSNVEMTDFATKPEWLGNGLAQVLLSRMEIEMKKKEIKTAYTIARAMSAGMNITFSRAGYHFGGRLKNNTNISGNIESMNVWYKKLIG